MLAANKVPYHLPHWPVLRTRVPLLLNDGHLHVHAHGLGRAGAGSIGGLETEPGDGPSRCQAQILEARGLQFVPSDQILSHEHQHGHLLTGLLRRGRRFEAVAERREDGREAGARREVGLTTTGVGLDGEGHLKGQRTHT